MATCPGLADPTWWLRARDPPLELKLGAGGSNLVASCPGLEEPTLEAEARGWRRPPWRLKPGAGGSKPGGFVPGAGGAHSGGLVSGASPMDRQACNAASYAFRSNWCQRQRRASE